MPLRPDDHLRWTAFLYVAGELSVDDEAAFEQVLEADQEAREAVAEAVELAGVLVMVPDRAISRSGRGRRALAWASVSMAAAACLAILVSPRPGPDRAKVADASAVARAWSGIRDKAAEPPGPEADWSPTVDEATAPAASGDRAVPAWLLTATSAPRDSKPLEEN